ncbi:IS3 family transposase [Pseudonocardia saturnea]
MTREAIYGFIAAEKTTYPVRLLCRVLQVSTSAFYDWIHRGSPTVSDADLDDAHAANQLHDAWAEHRRTYGARRLTAEIRDRDQQGQAWNHKRVARLMTVAGIEGIHRRRHGKKRSRIGAGSVAPDLVKRQFVAEAPGQLWVADISYLRTWEGFLYLAVVIDACTRRVVGWAMADHLRRELVLDALGMALHQRKPAVGLIHHSDHGVQYTSIDFGRTLRTSGVVASMGSIGDAFDNAMAESFFATLKEEMIYRRAWPTRHELEMEVFSFIEGFYNPLRRHSRLGNLSPAAYEQQITTQTEVSG